MMVENKVRNTILKSMRERIEVCKQKEKEYQIEIKECQEVIDALKSK